MEQPGFVAGRELLERAYRFAYASHEGPNPHGDTGIEHPTAVAALLDRAGFGEPVVAAAFLHDVVEDTDRGFEMIEEQFGAEVCRLVDAMTEDASVEDYGERKAEHRERALAAGPATASIYLADKLARVRRFRETGGEVERQRLDHFRDTLKLYGRLRPELPFLAELAEELPTLNPA